MFGKALGQTGFEAAMAVDSGGLLALPPPSQEPEPKPTNVVPLDARRSPDYVDYRSQGESSRTTPYRDRWSVPDGF
jgi:hypothetical protein